MAMLVLASVIMPLSFDMYTPAIPGMPEYFGTDAATVNLTLVSYFVFFAVGVIVFGPLSDRTGRRPVLLMGSVAYALGSVACALAPTVHALIGARVVQALGGGALSSVCTAVTKDSFEAAYRERVLSVVQVLFVAGPTLAPLLGAAIVTIADWRVSFWVLAAVGALFCVLAACFRETLPEGCRKTAGPGRGLVRLAGLVKDPGFMVFAVIGSMFRLPFMGCIRTLSGTVGMALAALPWCDYVTGVGILMVASMAAGLAGWMFLLGSRIPLACIKGSRPIRPFRTRR